MAQPRTNIHQQTCECDGEHLLVDRADDARVEACVACGRCRLVVFDPVRMVIPLRDFHLKRGVVEGRPLEDTSMAQRLVDCLVMDEWPSTATCTDFGIASPRHFAALRHAVGSGVSPYQLDRVLGDGPAITRLVSATAGAYGVGVEFRTLYDEWDDWLSWSLYAESPDPRGDEEPDCCPVGQDDDVD